MFQRLSTDTLNWIMIIGVILFVVEISFFHGGMIISALFSGIFVYFGWKHFYRLWGKILFWIGFISLLFSIFNMMAVRFFIVAGIILFLIDYSRSKKDTTTIKPIIQHEAAADSDPVVEMKPLFNTAAFKNQTSPDHAYEWNDINIHVIYGDMVIDLSNTVLPNDPAVISIRALLGNITVYVPYEVGVSIHHSSFFGRNHIFNEHHDNLMNQTLSYKTAGYDTSHPRVKIITALLSGDIEVKRI